MKPAYLASIETLDEVPEGHWVIVDHEGDGAYYYVGPQPSFRVAREWVGSWATPDPCEPTRYYNVSCYRVLDGELSGRGRDRRFYRVPVDPEEPPCASGDGHQWFYETEVVGSDPDVLTIYRCRYCDWQLVEHSALDLRDGTRAPGIEYVPPQA